MPWVKGQSGNPKGRPKKGRSLAENIDAIVDKAQLVRVLWKAAKKGEPWAVQLLFKCMLPAQPLLLRHEAVRDEQPGRFDYSKLSVAELDQLERLLERAGVGVGGDPHGALQAGTELLPSPSVEDH